MYSDSEQTDIEFSKDTVLKSARRNDLLERALALYRQGEYAEANLIYKQILAMNPEDTVGLLSVGELAQKLQKYDIANL